MKIQWHFSLRQGLYWGHRNPDPPVRALLQSLCLGVTAYLRWSISVLGWPACPALLWILGTKAGKESIFF